MRLFLSSLVAGFSVLRIEAICCQLLSRLGSCCLCENFVGFARTAAAWNSCLTILLRFLETPVCSSKRIDFDSYFAEPRRVLGRAGAEKIHLARPFHYLLLLPSIYDLHAHFSLNK